MTRQMESLYQLLLHVFQAAYVIPGRLHLLRRHEAGRVDALQSGCTRCSCWCPRCEIAFEQRPASSSDEMLRFQGTRRFHADQPERVASPASLVPHETTSLRSSPTS